MIIESFIQDTETALPVAHRLHDQVGSGHVYTSYPDGPGKFIAFIVECTSPETAVVHEVADGTTLELGFDPTELPEGTTRTDITVDKPYEKEIVSPDGRAATLIVRGLGTAGLN